MSSTSSVTLVKDSTAPRNISMNQEREMRHISPADAMPPPQPDDPPKAEGLNVGHEYTLSHAGVGKQLASSIASTQSIYWSARSIVRSVFTDSTGFRLLPGATWKEDLYRSMNSGFGSGAPRDQNYRSVQEGRERGGFLPRLRGVGRLGKRAVPVPAGLANAMGAQLREITEEQDETEEDFQKRQLIAKHRVEEFREDAERKEMIRRHDGERWQEQSARKLLLGRHSGESSVGRKEKHRAVLRQHWVEQRNDDIDLQAILKRHEGQEESRKELLSNQRDADYQVDGLEIGWKEKSAEEAQRLAILARHREEELKQDSSTADTDLSKREAILRRHLEEDSQRKAILKRHKDEMNIEQSQREALRGRHREANDSRQWMLKRFKEEISAELSEQEAVMIRHKEEIDLGPDLEEIESRQLLHLMDQDSSWKVLLDQQSQELLQYNTETRAQQSREMAQQNARQEAIYKRHLDELLSHDRATSNAEEFNMEKQIALREAMYKEHGLQIKAAHNYTWSWDTSELSRFDEDRSSDETEELEQKFSERAEMYSRQTARAKELHREHVQSRHASEWSDQNKNKALMLARQEIELKKKDQKRETQARAHGTQFAWLQSARVNSVGREDSSNASPLVI